MKVRRRGGWRRKRKRLQAYVRLYHGPGGLRTRTYPLGTSPADMQRWIDDTLADYRQKHPRGAPGTLRRDCETYLKLLVDRPRLHAERTRHLAWWCEQFGSRSRWTLDPVELETALRERTAAGAAASTVKKYRSALYHLFTKLDGKDASNPLRDVPPPREPEALPRALPYPLIEDILRHVPTARYERTLTAAGVALLASEAAAPGANLSALARRAGVSETMVRKIRDGRAYRTLTPALAPVGLRLMAYLGWAPAMIRAFRPADYDPATASVLARGRQKGAGTRAIRQPLTPQGVAAIEAWIAVTANRDPVVNATSWLRAWRRGIQRLCTALEREETTRALGAQLRRDLADVTPYALRHSFLTEVQLATGNIHTTQQYALHADPRMTRRYTLAAVDPELARAATLVAARFGGQRAGDDTPNAASESEQKRRTMARAEVATRSPRSRRKRAQLSRK